MVGRLRPGIRLQNRRQVMAIPAGVAHTSAAIVAARAAEENFFDYFRGDAQVGRSRGISEHHLVGLEMIVAVDAGGGIDVVRTTTTTLPT